MNGYVGPNGYAVVREDAASPRNTISAWLRRRMSSSSRRPRWAPTFDFGTVATLSTIRRQGLRNPLREFGETESLNSGASTVSVVKAQMVMESVASKLSSWTMTTGRGLPA